MTLGGFSCSDLEGIKQQCLWMDEVQRWKLPEVTYVRLKLPPANGINSVSYDQYETVVEANEDDQNDRLFKVNHSLFLLKELENTKLFLIEIRNWSAGKRRI